MRTARRILSLLLAFVLVCAPGFRTEVLAAGANANTPQTHPNTYINTGDQRKDILGVALTQVGYVEGSNNNTKYGAALNINELAWCGAFVSWCAIQAGVPDSVLTKTGLANPANYRLEEKYYPAYTPQPGDLFFAPDNTHVGLVHYVEGNYIHTIEGNVKLDGVEGVHLFKRKLTDVKFGAPAYQNNEPPATSGSCGATGSQVEWSLENGTLTLSGSGAVANYTQETHAPWYAHSNSIETVVVGNGITDIGDYAFYNSKVRTVLLPDGISYIGTAAFDACAVLETVFFRGSQQDRPQIGTKNLGLTAAQWHYEVEEAVFAQQSCYHCAECNDYILPNGSYALATVSFLNWDGSTIASGKYHCGEIVTAPADFSYPKNRVFLGWDKPVTACTDNAVYQAVFEKTLVPGDTTDDGEVTNDDVVYLLWHVLFGNEYPLSGNADFTGDAEIGNDDVVYLLWHLLFGDEYPIS